MHELLSRGAALEAVTDSLRPPRPLFLDGEGGRAPLHVASRNGHLEVIEELILRGAEVRHLLF